MISIFIVPGNFVADQLRKKYPVRIDNNFTVNREYFDTFDWRLYHKGWQLYSEQDKIHLRIGNSDAIEGAGKPSQIPFFASDLISDKIKTHIEPVTQPRALLSLLRLRLKVTNIRIMDNNDKTILRISIESLSSNHRVKQSLLSVQSLRGYQQAAHSFINWLKSLNLQKFSAGFFKYACDIKRITPSTYSSKLNLRLSHQMTVLTATKIIHEFLFGIMQQNEVGIINDIDTEFLHDFRVAVRRTRSLYTNVKSRIPADIYRRAQNDFRFLGKLTNRMRDIDVYLLKKPLYQSLVPADMHEDLFQFYQELKTERAKELSRLVRALKAKRYSRIKTFWQSYTARRAVDVEVRGDQEDDILSFARMQIAKRSRRVFKLGAEISPDSPDKELHKLRIECKKLRYLLEFYSSLFASEQVGLLIRQLKLLQDNLGDFNDLSIQQDRLRQYVENNRVKHNTILAIGFLVGLLNQRQVHIRGAFSQTFAKFSDPTTQSAITDITGE